MHAKLLSRVQLFVTLWTVAHQAPLSMGFSRQEYWSGLPSSRGSSRPREDANLHLLQLLHCRLILYLRAPRGSLKSALGRWQNRYKDPEKWNAWLI